MLQLFYILINLIFSLSLFFVICSYTESLYALLSIGGTYLLMSGANIFSVVLFALSGLSRSNGVVNAGYHGFNALHLFYYAMYVKKRAYVSIFYMPLVYYLVV